MIHRFPWGGDMHWCFGGEAQVQGKGEAWGISAGFCSGCCERGSG